MNTISREELMARMAHQQPMQLVMTLDRSSFERQHIPGSLYFDHMQDAVGCLSKDEPVIVYDTNPACPASYRAYYLLQSKGFKQVYRFAGGLEEWSMAGYPIEGSL